MKKFFKNILPFLFKEEKVKGHRPPNENGTDKEFIFIWYKKMEIGNKTQYSAKNRTKIIAKNREEAVEKMTNFAMRKMVLVIHEEKDYSASDLGQMDELFKKFNDLMDKTFNKN
jgi:hypothetical protein